MRPPELSHEHADAPWWEILLDYALLAAILMFCCVWSVFDPE